MMYILPQNKYGLVIQPLSEAPMNILFARFVAEKKVKGTIYVDHPDQPMTFYILHPYGLSLLFGKTQNEAFNRSLMNYMLNSEKTRSTFEWLQVFPDEWNNIIRSYPGNPLVRISEASHNSDNIIEEHTRVNFSFNINAYRKFRATYSNPGHVVTRSENNAFSAMKGKVIPANFWDSAEDFAKNGIAFSIYENNTPACTAYSAFIVEDCLEIGIETGEEFRGKGFAVQTCAALIDYCIQNGYTPVWSCRLENTGSYKLAQKLGFEPTNTFPFYRLPV